MLGYSTEHLQLVLSTQSRSNTHIVTVSCAANHCQQKLHTLNMVYTCMKYVSALTCAHIHNLSKNFRKGGSGCILPQSCRRGVCLLYAKCKISVSIQSPDDEFMSAEELHTRWSNIMERCTYMCFCSSDSQTVEMEVINKFFGLPKV